MLYLVFAFVAPFRYRWHTERLSLPLKIHSPTKTLVGPNYDACKMLFLPLNTAHSVHFDKYTARLVVNSAIDKKQPTMSQSHSWAIFKRKAARNTFTNHYTSLQIKIARDEKCILNQFHRMHWRNYIATMEKFASERERPSEWGLIDLKKTLSTGKLVTIFGTHRWFVVDAISLNFLSLVYLNFPKFNKWNHTAEETVFVFSSYIRHSSKFSTLRTRRT